MVFKKLNLELRASQQHQHTNGTHVAGNTSQLLHNETDEFIKMIEVHNDAVLAQCIKNAPH